MARNVGDKVLLPKGLRIGMGFLRSDRDATIDRVDVDSTGEVPMYGVFFFEKGRRRTTWVTEDDLTR